MITSLNLKQRMVGTPLGRLAIAARRTVERLRASNEMVGCVANDNLATFLTARLCRANATFADVGAHLGSMVAEVRRQCPTVEIAAFEAIPIKAQALRTKFPWLTVHVCAVADTTGKSRFFIDRAQSGYSSLADNGGEAIDVDLARLDDLLTQADVIKVDVEGAELGVLRGAEELVARSRPTIMLESGPQSVLGYTKELLFDWLHTRDYGVFVPNRLAHTGPPLSRDGFIDGHFHPRRTTNYFAVARERIEEIRERSFMLLHGL